MNRVKVAAVGLGVAGAIGLGVTLPGAFADEATPTPESAATAMEERHAEREGKFSELLAKELGLETAKVQEAVKAVREQLRAEAKADRLEGLKSRLDAAVKDGMLTQEQADAILDAAEAGVLPAGRGVGLGHFKHHGPGGRWG